MTEKEKFARSVYRVVSKIPRGKVLTYGSIAMLVGRPQNSRLVARLIAQIPLEEAAACSACHRVVNSMGRTAPGWPQQRTILEKEGVKFKQNGCVDLKQSFNF